MDVEVGPANVAPAAGDTGNIPVTLTNQSAECTLDGFPGIDLNATDSSASVSPGEGTKSTKLTPPRARPPPSPSRTRAARPGAKASLDVKTLNIALPGSGTAKSYKWSYGPVQGQSDNAGDPNASVSAFSPVGD